MPLPPMPPMKIRNRCWRRLTGRGELEIIGSKGKVMTRWLLLFVTLAALTLPGRAADLTGTWQADGKPQRVLKVQKAGNGYRGSFHNLGDEAPGASRNNTV